jgi:VWFA-related protein
MKKTWLASVAIALATIRAATPAGQTAAPRAPQSYTASTTAVLVDVVVRDSNGNPVTSLSAADFELSEDGVRQTLDTFTRVSRGSGIGVGVGWKTPGPITVSGSPAPGAPPTPDEETTTAFVFDHLSAESLGLAQKAVFSYVPMSGASMVRVGVFATGPGVRLVQPYTTDRALVRQGVARVTPAGASGEEQRAERADELTNRRRALEAQIDSASTAGGTSALAANASDLGRRETERRLIQTELNMIRAFDNLDRDHLGYDTARGLQSIIDSLSYWPGRKTIVFFSEGLPVSPTLSATLDAVIDAANRANVTTYAVDAQGLRTKSALAAPRKEMETFAEERFAQIGSGTDRTEQPLTMAFERVADTLTLDSRTGLARLATDTGGFLIEGTNDLAAAFRRIDEDSRFHYLLTYSPTNAVPDGKFRAIRVKVTRPGTHVFARKGYRALRARPAVDAGAGDAEAASLLDRTPLPNAFPVHAAGFSFPDPSRPGLTPVIVHVATGSLRFDVDAQRAAYSADATVLVRIRDGEGRTVQTLSQQYVVSGDGKDLEAAKSGNILFYREPELPPGVYTMEAIVFDAAARRGSARVSTLTVPARQSGALGMSSLMVINRAEETTGGRAAAPHAEGPFYVGRTLLYPNLGEPIRKSAASELAFYFVLYGEPDGVHASADLLRNGELIASAPVDLPRWAGGRVQRVGRLPIGRLPAGTYELRIVVTRAGRELSRTAYFTLMD